PSTPRQHYDRFQKGVRRLKQKTAKLLGRSSANWLEEEVVDLFSVARLPESFRALCEANYQATMDYRPQLYAGKVTLFRARSQPLFGRHGADLGWGKIAAGGLEIRVVPGTHDSILKEPHVKVLAQEFKAALSRV